MKKITHLLIILLLTVSSFPQVDTTVSLAFKKNRRYNPSTLEFKPPNDLVQLYDSFLLTKQANSGDYFAQHELGVRYLIGSGFPPDTVKSFYWINKAAQGKIAIAQYNLGIFYNNGWGTLWNPFKAFESFLLAAENNFPEAQFAVGIVYSEDLLVKRDLKSSFFWMKKAADNGVKNAKKILEEFEVKGIKSEEDAEKFSEDNLRQNSNNLFQLMYIDFSVSDSHYVVKDSVVIHEVLRTQDSVKLKPDNGNNAISGFFIDSLFVYKMEIESEFGSPEALNYLGRLYENGVFYKKDLIKAAVYFIRAFRLDSILGHRLLMNLLSDKNFYTLLKSNALSGDPDAKFVWAFLILNSLDNQLINSDAVKMLFENADVNHTPSIIELGTILYRGSGVKQDREKGIALWKRGEELGNDEAKVRGLLNRIINFDYTEEDLTLIIQYLQNTVKNNSVLGTVALGLCYERGLGLESNFAKASENYRLAAIRGSVAGYESLKRLYESVRPN
ncbi:MAG: tetratricopeptide repeat protein [Ignavibacteriaceae bacterium]